MSMKVLLNKRAIWKQTRRLGKAQYVSRTVTISVQITKVVITICRGDETVVIEIPIM